VRFFLRSSLIVICVTLVVAYPTWANVGGHLAPGSRSGERVRWEPPQLRRVLRSLRDEVRDPAVAAELAQVVHSESNQVAVDPLYVLALMKVESGFRADAVSPRGAVGLLQVRPTTARGIVRAESVAAAGPHAVRPLRLRDPRTNVALGLRYLQELEEEFTDPADVLAAYNMGPTRVRRRLAERKSVPRGYADRVRAAYRAFTVARDG
jgi:soluble lytic murein transglycosylase